MVSAKGTWCWLGLLKVPLGVMARDAMRRVHACLSVPIPIPMSCSLGGSSPASSAAVGSKGSMRSGTI
eukprot:scaffold18185_cov106-Isochrysis_galbana.AAC.5